MIKVLRVKKHSEKTLAKLLRFFCAWEIPITAINADAGGLISHSDSRKPTEKDWAKQKLVCFPDVEVTYVLECKSEEQEQALQEFVTENNSRLRQDRDKERYGWRLN